MPPGASADSGSGMYSDPIYFSTRPKVPVGDRSFGSHHGWIRQSASADDVDRIDSHAAVPALKSRIWKASAGPADNSR